MHAGGEGFRLSKANGRERVFLSSCYLSNTAATICVFSNSQSKQPQRQWEMGVSWQEPLVAPPAPWIDANVRTPWLWLVQPDIPEYGR
jgi:hypothetical protein